MSDRRRHASADCELNNDDGDHPEERDGDQNPNTKAPGQYCADEEERDGDRSKYIVPRNTFSFLPLKNHELPLLIRLSGRTIFGEQLYCRG